jgi:uncharacterized membrane protein
MAIPHIIAGTGDTAALPVVRTIGVLDLRDALVNGVSDFWEAPTHMIFLSLIYPLIGLFIGRLLIGADVAPLMFPIAAGFALIGPFAAVGLYELSRRRERGMPLNWTSAFQVAKSPSLDAILALGALLVVIFLIWIAVAQALYQSLFGYGSPGSISEFFDDLTTTREGTILLVAGMAIGLVFAAVVLTISVVSFPLLLDRDVGAIVAMYTSVRAVLANPTVMALWGLIVAAALLVGSLPLFIGLSVVMPVLGHATWHLYRRVVVA